MYIFDILVDVLLKFPLKKKCWPQQTKSVSTSFHFTTSVRQYQPHHNTYYVATLVKGTSYIASPPINIFLLH